MQLYAFGEQPRATSKYDLVCFAASLFHIWLHQEQRDFAPVTDHLTSEVYSPTCNVEAVKRSILSHLQMTKKDWSLLASGVTSLCAKGRDTPHFLLSFFFCLFLLSLYRHGRAIHHNVHQQHPRLPRKCRGIASQRIHSASCSRLCTARPFCLQNYGRAGPRDSLRPSVASARLDRPGPQSVRAVPWYTLGLRVFRLHDRCNV